MEAAQWSLVVGGASLQQQIAPLGPGHFDRRIDKLLEKLARFGDSGDVSRNFDEFLVSDGQHGHRVISFAFSRPRPSTKKSETREVSLLVKGVGLKFLSVQRANSIWLGSPGLAVS